MYSRIVNAAAGVLSSFSQDFYFFLILRFLSGVGSVKKRAFFLNCNFLYRVGGSIPVVWTYFGEFQPSDKRGAALSVLATFWMVRLPSPTFSSAIGHQVGNIAVAALAWAVIPHDIGWSDPAHFQVHKHLCLCLFCVLSPHFIPQYNSWRVFVALCAVPSFLVAIALLRLVKIFCRAFS